jgi:hypothetical protein
MAKKLSAMATVFLSLFLLSLVGLIILPFVAPMEGFGAQGGEMVQLAAGRVQTVGDIQRKMEEENEQMRKDLIDMTGAP